MKKLLVILLLLFPVHGAWAEEDYSKKDCKKLTQILKTGEELTANYNLYTYPKTGVGFQTL